MSSEPRARQLLRDFRGLLHAPASRGIPKYVVLRDALAGLIRGGRWAQGDRVPTEEQLVAASGYSLGTVQRALRDLVAQRIVVRRQGQGSFVADQSRLLDHSSHCKFLDDSARAFVPIYSKALARRRTRRAGPWSQFVGAVEDGWLRIDRRVSINNEFFVASRFYCDPGRLGYLEECPLDELSGANFIALMSAKCGIAINCLNSYVTIKAFPREVCRLIGAKQRTVGLYVQSTGHAAGHDVVYYQEFHVPRVDRPLCFSEDLPFLPPSERNGPPHSEFEKATGRRFR